MTDPKGLADRFPEKRKKGSGIPARGTGDRHPDFEPNNLAAVTHGARSDRLVAAGAKVFEEALLREAPWLGAPHFAAAVSAWSMAEERARRFLEHADAAALLDSEGNETGASVAAGRWSDRSARLREALGLTPSSYARIRRDLASANRDFAGELMHLESAGG